MERQEQLKFCKKCKNQKFDRQKGILCQLTNTYANFQITCNDFNEDTDLQLLEEKRQKEIELDTRANKSVKQIVIFILSLLLLDAILTYFFRSFKETSVVLSRIVAFILFGFILVSAYYRLPYFEWRFRRMIRMFGKESSRIVVIVVMSIFIVMLFIIRYLLNIEL